MVSLYVPYHNPKRDQFFNLAASFVDPSLPTLLCGDNAVFDCSLDRAGSDISDTSRESTSSLVCLFDACCVVITWRYLHPPSFSFTWTRPDRSLSSRNDFIVSFHDRFSLGLLAEK